MARPKKNKLPKTAVPNQIVELENAIAEVRGSRKPSPRTARLITAGVPRMAQKVAEEATEVVIEAVRSRRAAVIGESVDLIYNLGVCGASSKSLHPKCGSKWIAGKRCSGWPRNCQRTPWQTCVGFWGSGFTAVA